MYIMNTNVDITNEYTFNSLFELPVHDILVIAGKVVYRGKISTDSKYYEILMDKLERKGIKISKILDKDGFLNYLREAQTESGK